VSGNVNLIQTISDLFPLKVLGEWVRLKKNAMVIFCKNDDMKSKLFLFLFSSWIFFGLISSAKWKSLLKRSNGDVHYIDFENPKKDAEHIFP